MANAFQEENPQIGFISEPPDRWDYEADVVIIGAGIAGLVAAIRARDLGESVLCVEANYCCGGHALTSGGHVHLGGGHSLQRRMGVNDSADQYYLDHTHPFANTARYNTREVVRASADSHAAGFEFLLENGWLHQEDSKLRVDPQGHLTGHTGADTVPRTITTDETTNGWNNPPVSNTQGIGLTRPLEVSARKKGVQFLMNHHMDTIFRKTQNSGRVLGLRAGYTTRILPGK